MNCKSILTAICLICLATIGWAGELAEPKETSVSNFFTPDGQFDIEAARRAGFEGSLDLEGLDVLYDPRTGEPLFSAAAGVNSLSDSPDDIYWDNSISPSVAGVDGTVHAAAVYDGQLVVGWKFQVAGDTIVNYIAAWDGTSWSPLGSGLISSSRGLKGQSSYIVMGLD